MKLSLCKYPRILSWMYACHLRFSLSSPFRCYCNPGCACLGRGTRNSGLPPAERIGLMGECCCTRRGLSSFLLNGIEGILSSEGFIMSVDTGAIAMKWNLEPPGDTGKDPRKIQPPSRIKHTTEVSSVDLERVDGFFIWLASRRGVGRQRTRLKTFPTRVRKGA